MSASAANAGTPVIITASATAAGTLSGTLTIKSGTHTSRVSLSATAVEGVGLSIGRVTAESIELRWVNAHGDDALYELNVTTEGVSVDGFPEVVEAADEGYVLTDLEPSTRYAISLETPDGLEGPVTVTTATAVPVINVTASGSLEMESGVGEATEPLELTIETRYVDGNIAVSIGAPFELSTDKVTWSRSLELLPEEVRFYLRAAASEAGDYASQLRVSGGGADWEGDVALTVSDAPYFLETFEVDSKVADKVTPYKNNITFEGVAGSWTLGNAGLENGNGKRHGTYSVRFGKQATSSLTLASDLTRGAGTVSFYAANWTASEATPTVHVESSTDGGTTWTDHGNVSVTGTELEPYSINVKESGTVRIRLRQSAGARFNLDDISVSPYHPSAIAPVGADTDEASTWDAYCRDGRLIIEGSKAATPLSVYTIDGAMIWAGAPAATISLPLPPATVYIVASPTHARQVLIR